jgi:hypothetical protein
VWMIATANRTAAMICRVVGLKEDIEGF